MEKITIHASFERPDGYLPIEIESVVEDEYLGGALQIYGTLDTDGALTFEIERDDEAATLYSKATLDALYEDGWIGVLADVTDTDGVIRSKVVLADFHKSGYKLTKLSKEEWLDLFEKDQDHLPIINKKVSEAIQQQVDEFKARAKDEWHVDPNKIRIVA